MQWLQVRSSGAEPASCWHLAGIAAAVVTWLVWPTSPGILYGADKARNACSALGQSSPDCLAHAMNAIDASNLCLVAHRPLDPDHGAARSPVQDRSLGRNPRRAGRMPARYPLPEAAAPPLRVPFSVPSKRAPAADVW